MSQVEKASKLLSYMLRHKPEVFNITLDKEGWASVEEIVANTSLHAIKLTEELITRVVMEDDKGRYELSPYRDEIRAVQGHSTTSVDIAYPTMTPPDRLYHGTATKNLDSIRKHGLVSANRQYVHLSESIDTATAVGRRHGDPVVITVDAKQMSQAGYKFYLAPNGVWLVEAVNTDFLICSVTSLMT